MQQLPLFPIEAIDKGVAGFNNRITTGGTIAGVCLGRCGVGKAKTVAASIHNLIAARKHRALHHFGNGVSGGETDEIVGDSRMGVARTG